MGKFDGYLFVSDMDATLLSSNHTVSPENRRAIEYFIENGGRFTVASGRMPDAVRSYLSDIPLNAPAVLHNGAMLYDFDKNEKLYEKMIEEQRKEIVRRVYDDMPNVGIEVYADDTVYIYRTCDETARFLKRGYSVVYSLPDDVWERPWIKTLFIADEDVITAIDPILREKYGAGNLLRSGDRYLDMMAEGVSKGDGVLRLASMLGIGADKIIAAGDNMNDIAMLKAAGISWAVENASPDAKAAALFSAPDNDSNAIAYIVNHI